MAVDGPILGRFMLRGGKTMQPERHDIEDHIGPDEQMDAIGFGAGRMKGLSRMDDSRPTQVWTHRTREVVGVFVDPRALESAVKHLREAGFHPADISVLGTDQQVKAAIGHLYRSVSEIEDDPRTPRADFVPEPKRYAGEVAAFALPLYFGGLVGAAAVIASGGALSLAVAATILGSAGGASIGGLLAEAIAQHHAHRVEEQLARGGIVLWIKTTDAEQERRVTDIFHQVGADHVHVHEKRAEWSRKTP